MDRSQDHTMAMDRALGALLGVAMGDALGMPSQTMTRPAIEATYGEITGFLAAAADQPVSAGLPAGTITDDTEQSLLLARLLIEGGGQFDEARWAQALLAWEQDTRDRGVHDLLGPSTKRALEQLMRGVPASESGRYGTTNGAAMRIIPVGIATAAEPLGALVDQVEATCRLTHNSSDAIAAAAAVAAVVSAGMDGASFEDAGGLAVAAAREGDRRGYGAGAGEMANKIEQAMSLAANRSGQSAANQIADQIGNSVAAIESIPIAFAIARLAAGDPWQAGLLSANIGNDTDTIGAISVGMAAACSGASRLPGDKVAQVVQVNRLDLAPVAEALLKLRWRPRAASQGRVPA